jgi:hypothetical protein
LLSVDLPVGRPPVNSVVARRTGSWVGGRAGVMREAHLPAIITYIFAHLRCIC